MEDCRPQLLKLSRLPIYSRREFTAVRTFTEWKPRLWNLTSRKFVRQNHALIARRYCTAITRDRERIFHLVGQDRYLRGRVRALAGLLNECTGDKKRATALLVLAKYDVIAVSEIIPSLFLLSLVPPVVNYRDESLNLQYLIPEADRGIADFLRPDYRPLLFNLPERSNQADNLQDFTELPFQVHHPRVIMDPPQRPLITIKADEAIATLRNYQQDLLVMAGARFHDAMFRRVVVHGYDVKLRGKGIPQIDKDFYIMVRVAMAVNVLQGLCNNSDSRLAAMLLFLGHNDVVVAAEILRSGSIRDLFSAAGAEVLTAAETKAHLPRSTHHPPSQTTSLRSLPVHSLSIPESSSQTATAFRPYPPQSTSSHADSPLTELSSDSDRRPDTEPNMDDAEDRSQFYNEDIPDDLDPASPTVGYPPRNAHILSDKWLWETRQVGARHRYSLWRRTFKNKGAVRAGVSGNGPPVVLRNPISGKYHYAVIFGITHLIGEKERVRAVHSVTLTTVNGLPAKESITSTYAYGDEVSEDDLDAYKPSIKRKIAAAGSDEKRQKMEGNPDPKDKKEFKKEGNAGPKGKGKLKEEPRTEHENNITMESDIEISSDADSKVDTPDHGSDKAVAVLVRGFAEARKDHLRMLSLTKIALTKELTKAERKEASKALNAIKDSADKTISMIVGRYPELVFLNPSRVDESIASVADDTLPHVRTYRHGPELNEFLDKETHRLNGRDFS